MHIPEGEGVKRLVFFEQDDGGFEIYCMTIEGISFLFGIPVEILCKETLFIRRRYVKKEE